MNRILLFLTAMIGLCMSTAIAGDDILFTIDGDAVNTSEFEYIYNKNNFNNKADYSDASLREYLDLYIKFRLKVKEAESMGLDKDPKLHRELKVYQEQLYNSFYDREKLGALLDEAIERSAHDIGISHIYVSAAKGSGEEKIKDAQEKIGEAYNMLKSGTSWNDVAKTYSEDKYTKDAAGYLGYYTALQIAHYPLENAAYNTKAGSYSGPVQTDLGFHIVKVNDKRPARGKIHVAVIKLNKKKDDPAYNIQIAENIKEIYNKAASGDDFAQLAKINSEDPTTAGKGGEMEWFGISKYDPTFEDVAFGLDKDNEISHPFETAGAWYILKRLEKKEGNSKDIDKDLITKKVKQSDRYKIQRKGHIQEILDRYGFELKQPSFIEFRKFAIGRFESNVFRFEEVETKSDVMNIAGNSYTNVQLGQYLTKNTYKYRRLPAANRFDQLFEDFKEEKAIEFHIYEYAKENKEYGALMNEYRDGILLFDLMEQKVWSKAVQDTAGLRAYFNTHRENFKNPESAEIRTFKVGSEKNAVFLSKALKNDPELINMSWLTKLRKKGIRTSHDKTVINKDDALASNFPWSKGIYTVKTESGIEVWQVTGILPQTNKRFEDSKGFAIAEYQEFLETQWVNELEDKYKVVIDEDVLSGLVK
ncbi:MAG: hypothetical protein GY751_04365 [Bacteroidetes bacterium]|nr:hypothetical protein [Bacteroidota bacterium]